MDMFSRHKLVKTQNGYTLVLFIEKQNSEFAEEFISSLTDIGKRLQENSLEYIRKIIDENYHDKKIDGVKIMLGSLLIASIGFNTVEMSIVSASSAANQTQAKATIVYTVKPGDTLFNIAKSHNTSTIKLKEVNKLTGDFIYPGQKQK